MTEQEKQLLKKALCAILPYKLHCRVFRLNGDIKENDDILYGVIGDNAVTLKSDKDECLIYYQIKPYLRPMESLTKEERIEIGKAIQKDRINPSGEIKEEGSDNLLLCTVRQSTNLLNWMNSNHIDYCGLIPMGLALPAPEGMYK